MLRKAIDCVCVGTILWCVAVLLVFLPFAISGCIKNQNARRELANDIAHVEVHGSGRNFVILGQRLYERNLLFDAEGAFFWASQVDSKHWQGHCDLALTRFMLGKELDGLDALERAMSCDAEATRQRLRWFLARQATPRRWEIPKDLVNASDDLDSSFGLGY